MLGIRQDFPEYVRNRLPGRGWGWAVGAARGIELVFRLLARRAPTVVVIQRRTRVGLGGIRPSESSYRPVRGG